MGWKIARFPLKVDWSIKKALCLKVWCDVTQGKKKFKHSLNENRVSWLSGKKYNEMKAKNDFISIKTIMIDLRWKNVLWLSTWPWLSGCLLYSNVNNLSCHHRRWQNRKATIFITRTMTKIDPQPESWFIKGKYRFRYNSGKALLTYRAY